MKTAIILHGMPSKESYYSPDNPSQSNKHWLPWLQQQLILKGVLAQTPELPRPYQPDYEDWEREAERFDIGLDTILVGHSAGGGFWIRWLSENSSVKVGRVVLVAPSLGLDWDREVEFFKYDIDPQLASRTKGLSMIFSDNDKPAILKARDKFSELVKDVKILNIPGHGHFTQKDMNGKTDFPELLEECLKRNTQPVK